MAWIDCTESPDAVETVFMGAGPLQKRLKRAGFTQKDFAELLGMSENAVSSQLNGKVAGGTSRYILVIIMALERLSLEQRDALVSDLNSLSEKP